MTRSIRTCEKNEIKLDSEKLMKEMMKCELGLVNLLLCKWERVNLRHGRSVEQQRALW
jgi:hypothetical protein